MQNCAKNFNTPFVLARHCAHKLLDDHDLYVRTCTVKKYIKERSTQFEEPARKYADVSCAIIKFLRKQAFPWLLKALLAHFNLMSHKWIKFTQFQKVQPSLCNVKIVLCKLEIAKLGSAILRVDVYSNTKRASTSP